MNRETVIVLAIESSNIRGMGHLFRSLLYVDYLKRRGMDFFLLINRDSASERILKERDVEYIVVDYSDQVTNWERDIIKKYRVTHWLNDKFETSEQMGRHISSMGIGFFVLDDMGAGERYADISFCGMLYPTKKKFLCKEVRKGLEYIILNPEIESFQRERYKINKIIVALGGSDTYGATIEVADALRDSEIEADILIGPDFAFQDELERHNDGRYKVMQNLPSLIKIFYEYDLAVTGGGVTCCEAMASGLPCFIIANEKHEVNTAKFFDELGAGVYLGEHGSWNRNLLNKIDEADVNTMSNMGMKLFKFDAVHRIFDLILENNCSGGKQNEDTSHRGPL